MKNLRTIKDVEKEFDEKIGFLLPKNIRIKPESYRDEKYAELAQEFFKNLDDRIKSFISSSLRELLEQVVPEEKDTFLREDDYYHERAFGFNTCRQQTLDRINKILNN